MIELLVLFALAVVVLYRLKTVIGTRTGHEAPPEFLRRQQEARPDEHERAQPVADIRPVPDEDDFRDTPESSRASVKAIRGLEPDFSTAEFLTGARAAYEMILMAYDQGDRDTLRNLLAPDVFNAFEEGIKEREAEGLRIESRFIGVRDARAEEISFDPESRIADITIRFVSEVISAVHDAENRVVEGDPNEIRRQTDHWTFSREMGSTDPNWLLTGTGG